MAHYDKEQGIIVLTQEEKQTFKEAQINSQNKRTPTADAIMKWVLQDIKIEK